MEKAITQFRGKYGFLSNFYPVFVTYEGMRFAAVEDAFQAAKTYDLGDRKMISLAPSPADAKRMGRRVTLRPDWDIVKDSIMKDLLLQKFSQPEFRNKLLSTGQATLIEGNTHGDRYWGKVNGEGKNRLGELLMEVRSELRQEGSI